MGFSDDYPWVNASQPFVVSAPMMKISLGDYALATSSAGGLGFLAGGFDLSPLKKDLADADALLKSKKYPNLDYHDGLLPIGVGVQNWGAKLDSMVAALEQYPVAAVWFFAPKQMADLLDWSKAVHKVSPKTKVWVQIGSVGEAREVANVLKPDVIVVQGADAGGHGLAQRAGIVTLLPEVKDALLLEDHSIPLIAAGGIIDGRGVAAAYALGASGICMGTRLLASHEAILTQGYQREVVRATDGGVHTIASKVYDNVRGIKGWPEGYHGRGVINQSYLDSQAGMTDEENEAKYKLEMEKGDAGWGPEGRMTTYAGTGVGLVREVMSIEQIIQQVQFGATEILRQTASQFGGGTNGALHA